VFGDQSKYEETVVEVTVCWLEKPEGLRLFSYLLL